MITTTSVEGDGHLADWAESFCRDSYCNTDIERLILSGLPLSEGNFHDKWAWVRASEVLAVRACIQGSGKIWISAPRCSPSNAQAVAVAVALTELSIRLRQKTSLTGDLVLVTQQVMACRAALESIRFGAGTQVQKASLGKGYRIAPLIRRESTDGGNLYLSNPGRLSEMSRPFWAVVVDATHPRTLSYLNDVLSTQAVNSTNVQIVVAPSGHERNAPPGFKIWMWDPESERRVNSVLGVSSPARFVEAGRVHRVVSDPPLENMLLAIRQVLIEAMSVMEPGPTDWVLRCWQMYHRLRQASVDLAILDRVATGYTRSVRSEIDEIFGAQALSSRFWDLNRAFLSDSFESAYKHLLTIGDPSKFYAVGEAVADHFNRSQEKVRVVVGTKAETSILQERLVELVDGYENRLRDGQVEVVSASRDAILASEAEPVATILLGHRTSARRYLDLFSPTQIDIVLYDYEAEIDIAALSQLYGAARDYCTPSRRLSVLTALNLAKSGAVTPDPAPPSHDHPPVHRIGAAQRVSPRQLLTAVDDFAFEYSSSLNEAQSSESASRIQSDQPCIQIEIEGGTTLTFAARRKVDLYVPELGAVERVAAENVKRESYLIVLVDEIRQNLSGRLFEILDRGRSREDVLRLTLWKYLKHGLYREFDYDYMRVYRCFDESLSVQASALRSWFSEEKEDDADCVAPARRDDFEILSDRIAALADKQVRGEVWNAIECQRNDHRRWGRKLSAILAKALPKMIEGASPALESALGTPIEEMMAAVDVYRVISVRALERK